jgi:hypothetical protein
MAKISLIKKSQHAMLHCGMAFSAVFKLFAYCRAAPLPPRGMRAIGDENLNDLGKIEGLQILTHQSRPSSFLPLLIPDPAVPVRL